MNLTNENIQLLAQAVKAALKEDFDDINRKFGDIDKKFTGIDSRLKGVESELKMVNKRLENIEISLSTIGEEVARNIMPLYATYDEHRRLEKRVERIEQKVQN